MFTGLEVYMGSFSFDLKLVVHQAPVAMCPTSVAVVFRRISALSVKVIFQSEALVSPTEWAFQKILFCSGLRERSPSMFIVSEVFVIRSCCESCIDGAVVLPEAGVFASKRIGRLAISARNSM